MEPPSTVLVIHPDDRFRQAGLVALRRSGYLAAASSQGQEALDLTSAGLIHDIIVFDDAVKDMAPAHFAAALTETLGELAPPVIYIVNSRGTSKTLILPPFRPGQDVVLERPDLARAVIKAIFSVLRRSAEEGSVVGTQGLELDVLSRTLRYRGRSIHLTRLEYGFMEYTMRRSGRVVTNEELLQHVWGFEPSTGTGEVVRAHVRNLRLKLAHLGAPPDLIRTLPRRGYRLGEAPPSTVEPGRPSASNAAAPARIPAVRRGDRGLPARLAALRRQVEYNRVGSDTAS